MKELEIKLDCEVRVRAWFNATMLEENCQDVIVAAKSGDRGRLLSALRDAAWSAYAGLVNDSGLKIDQDYRTDDLAGVPRRAD